MKKIFLLSLWLLLTSISINAQKDSIDEKMKSETIKQVATMLEEKYVLPEVGKKYSEHLLTLLSQDHYTLITSGEQLAKQIESDLKEVRIDLHLKVSYNPQRVKNMREAENKSDEEKQKNKELQLVTEQKKNFGAKELKILPGNIGYFRLDEFPGEAGSETLISALSFLQYSDAIILDLRENGGGNPEMIMLMGSYFFEEDNSVFFSSFFHRIRDKTYQHRSFFYVPGKRIPKTKLYILISKNTFSAAEGFAYDFKQIKRATIVGEKTKGAAHVANPFIVNEYFLLTLPFAKPINPITNSSWEGTGVEPDIPCEAEHAIDDVYKIELDRISKGHTDEAFLNTLGYELIAEKLIGAAIEAFLINVNLFPNSANVYDSLGEAYLQDDQTDLAIQNYQKSLELNPQNENARIVLEKLRKNNHLNKKI